MWEIKKYSVLEKAISDTGLNLERLGNHLVISSLRFGNFPNFNLYLYSAQHFLVWSTSLDLDFLQKWQSDNGIQRSKFEEQKSANKTFY